MLRQVAKGVLVHQSEFLQTNTVVVQGGSGVLLIDPGVQGHELACLAADLAEAGHTVAAGFSTHPHWDHLLWIDGFGDAPRYGTARCAATAHAKLPDAAARAGVARMIPEDAVDVPLDHIGVISGLPDGAEEIPWDGPRVRIIEHHAHAPGHAALLIEDRGVLVAGDLLSDVLVPMVDLMGEADPVGEYLTALALLEGVAGGVGVLIPGHGSVADGAGARARITQDRAYVLALRDDEDPADPRIGTSAKPGWEWVASLHEGQRKQFAARA